MDPVDNPVKDKDPLPKDLFAGPVEDRGRLSIDSITRSILANHSHLKETIAGPVRAKIPDIDTLSGTVQSSQGLSRSELAGYSTADNPFLQETNTVPTKDNGRSRMDTVAAANLSMELYAELPVAADNYIPLRYTNFQLNINGLYCGEVEKLKWQGFLKHNLCLLEPPVNQFTRSYGKTT
jgi:hypothetical protein